MDGSAALALYRQEKERALQERRISHAQLMAEAKEAFAKMLADAQLARKGGRPKKEALAQETHGVVAGGSSAHGMTAAKTPVKVSKLEALEQHIDECLHEARLLDKDGLEDVINHLRRARNAVVWKIGQ